MDSGSSTREGAIAEFGGLLRDWRRHRGISQLTLSQACGISQRHISFLETGRASPSRQSVVALAEALDVPLRERNALLRSAGHAALYAQTPARSPDNDCFHAALDALLAQQEPYPALVLDGRWNLVKLNPAAGAFFGRFIDLTPLADGATGDYQLVQLCLSDTGLKPFLVNWQQLGQVFLQRARRALLVNPRDEPLAALVQQMLAHPQAPERWRTPDWTASPKPALTMELRLGEERFSLMTMHAHFGAPQEVAIEELSVELFYPADEATRRYFQG